MSTIQEKIAVMQAFAEGREVQLKSWCNGDWKDCPNPRWNWHDFDYRIKPVPQAKYILSVRAKHGNFVTWSSSPSLLICEEVLGSLLLEHKEHTPLFVVKVTEDGKTEVAHVNPDGILQAPSGF